MEIPYLSHFVCATHGSLVFILLYLVLLRKTLNKLTSIPFK